MVVLQLQFGLLTINAIMECYDFIKYHMFCAIQPQWNSKLSHIYALLTLLCNTSSVPRVLHFQQPVIITWLWKSAIANFTCQKLYAFMQIKSVENQDSNILKWLRSTFWVGFEHHNEWRGSKHTRLLLFSKMVAKFHI